MVKYVARSILHCNMTLWPNDDEAVMFITSIKTVLGMLFLLGSGTLGTVRIAIHGRHTLNNDFMVSPAAESQQLELFKRGSINAFLITSDGRLLILLSE